MTELLPSVIPSLASFGGHWIAALILFVVLFAALTYLFARERMGQMIAGFFSTIASLFTSPFVYLRNAMLRLADFGDKGDTQYRSSRLYLVNKLLLVLHAIIIVVALGGLTATLITAWYTFLPPEHLRKAASNLEESLAAQRAELAPLTAKVKQFDDEWQAKRQALVDKFKQERQQKADAAAKAKAEFEATANSTPELGQAYASVRNYLDQARDSASEDQLNRYHQSVVDFTGRLSLDDASRARLVQYADNWRTERLMRRQLAAMSEQDLRAQAQPEYPAAAQRASELEARIRNQEQELAQVREQTRYSPGPAALILVSGVFGFIFTLWMVGLFIEMLSLFVHMADDIRRLREATEREGAKASTPASLAGLS